jgi:hypothetical protein
MNRERQRQLDLLAAQFIAALDAGDFDAVARLWALAADDAELEACLVETAEALGEAYDQEALAAAGEQVTDLIEKHMPSAEVMRPAAGPLTAADVAEHLRRHPPAGLTADELMLNEKLRQAADELPAELGLTPLLEWGRRFGDIPDAYWRAFRQTALTLRMRRESEAHYQLAARQTKPRRPGGQP